jgi:hypothetical protein
MTGNSKLDQVDVDLAFSDPALQNLVVEAASRWVAVLLTYLKETQTEIDCRLVVEINELLDAIEDRGSAEEIFRAYKRLIDKARTLGSDYLDMPIHFFGRSFH